MQCHKKYGISDTISERETSMSGGLWSNSKDQGSKDTTRIIHSNWERMVKLRNGFGGVNTC